jgi:pimeloyl-ACP methyl ester carboxylesterase
VHGTDEPSQAGTRPVVLVHGFASSFRRQWVEPGWCELLAEMGRPLLGGDLLGHGSSAKPHDPAAYSTLADQVCGWLPSEPVDAVGFSLGARLLLEVAVARPGSFARLVLGGVGENLLRPEDPQLVAQALATGAEGPSGSVAQALVRFARDEGNDPLALAACLLRPSRALSPDQLRQVEVPTLVVVGSQDFAGPGEPLVELLPAGRLVTIEGADHLATARHFRFLDAALGFLEPGPP